MSEQQNTNQSSAGRLSPTMIAALIFLLVSLIGSAIFLRSVFPSPTPEPESEIVMPTDLPAPTEVPSTTESTATPDETPIEIPIQSSGDGLLVKVVAINADDDQATGLVYMEAIQQELARVFPSAGITVDIAEIAVADPTNARIHDLAPDSLALILWQDMGDGVIRSYLFLNTQPPLIRIDEEPPAWVIRTPENMPIYTTVGSGFHFPIEILIGGIELEGGRYAQAEQRFRDLQGSGEAIPIEYLSAQQAAIQMGIGQAQYEQGKLRDALQTYSQALRLENDFPAATLNRGNVYLALRDTATAQSAYRSLPDSPATLYNRAVASRQAGALDSAMIDSEAILDLLPDAGWAHNLYGFLNYELGNTEQAMRGFTQTKEIVSMSAIPPFNQGATAIRDSSYEEALGFFEQALDIEPNHPVFHAYRGLAYQGNGDLARAERSFNRAIEFDKNYRDAYLWRARFYLDEESYEQARADAEQILALDENEGQAWLIIGHVYAAEQDFVEAERAYTTAIDLGVEAAEVYAGRAWAWHNRYYYGYAALDYAEAVQAGNTDPELLYRLGMALLDADRVEDALNALLGAINGGLDTAEAHAALAVALDANLKRDEAEQAYQTAIDLDGQVADAEYLAELPLWSASSVSRAVTIIRRIEAAQDE